MGDQLGKETYGNEIFGAFSKTREAGATVVIVYIIVYIYASVHIYVSVHICQSALQDYSLILSGVALPLQLV